MSKIEAKRSSEQFSRGTRLMIIKLGKYNQIGELLIRKRTTGLQAQVNYQDGVQEALVTMAAVHMGVKETGMQTRYRGTYNQPPSWDQDQGRMQALQSNQEVLAGNKLEIDWKEKRVGTLRSQVRRSDGLPMRQHRWCMVA